MALRAPGSHRHASPQSTAPAVLPLLPLPLAPLFQAIAGPSPGSGNLLSLKERDLPGLSMSDAAM